MLELEGALEELQERAAERAAAERAAARCSGSNIIAFASEQLLFNGQL